MWDLVGNPEDRFSHNKAHLFKQPLCVSFTFSRQASVGVGSYYGTYFLLDELSCNGTESSLEECGHDGWGNHDCFDWEVAGVECSLIDGTVKHVLSDNRLR